MERGRLPSIWSGGVLSESKAAGAVRFVGLSKPGDGNSRPDLVSSRGGRK